LNTEKYKNIRKDEENRTGIYANSWLRLYESGEWFSYNAIYLGLAALVSDSRLVRIEQKCTAVRDFV